jgi:hypothetical protein
VTEKIFPNNPLAAFKHLCGEYPTSNAFALWLSAKILKEKEIPPTVLQKGTVPKDINRILIYNQYFGDHHSLILTQSC